MEFLQTLGEKIYESFVTLWDAFVNFLPGLLTALILFVIGWIIAVALGKIVEQIIRGIKADQALEKLGFKSIMDKAGLKLDTGRFFEELVRWFIILVALMVAVDILGLSQVTMLLQRILLYIPQVIVAALILLAGVLIASFLEKIVVASVEAANLKQSSFVGTLTKWFTLIFAILLAFSTLSLPAADIILTGIIAAFALAFGLGGKDAAAELINKLKKDITGK